MLREILILLAGAVFVASSYADITEANYNAMFCADVGGKQETRHDYNYGSGESYVFVDCETSDMVWEGGLDKRSSLDSVQQALFAGYITGKRPAVVIYDTDGKEGRFEYRILRLNALGQLLNGMLFFFY